MVIPSQCRKTAFAFVPTRVERRGGTRRGCVFVPVRMRLREVEPCAVRRVRRGAPVREVRVAGGFTVHSPPIHYSLSPIPYFGGGGRKTTARENRDRSPLFPQTVVLFPSSVMPRLLFLGTRIAYHFTYPRGGRKTNLSLFCFQK